MGRQIEFLHSEIDTKNFLLIIEQFNGRLIIDGVPISPTGSAQCVIREMNSFSCKFRLLPSCYSDTALSRSTERTIEFSNSCRGNSASRTYEVGRLYIAPNNVGQYDEQTLNLYNKLRNHIKNNYYYSTKSHVYFAENFFGYYKSSHYYAVKGGIPIRF